MAEDLLYDEQVDTGQDQGDPDPLGIRKQLKQKPDPLGLRAHLTPAPKPAFHVDISQPSFGPETSAGTRTFSFEKQPDEGDYLKLHKQALEAKDALHTELSSNDAKYEEQIRQHRKDNYTIENLRNDAKQKGVLISPNDEAGMLKRAQQQQYDRPVTPEDISDIKTGTILNQTASRKFIKGVSNPTIQKNAYLVDAFNYTQNDPNKITRAPKIKENAKQIEKGTLTYDPESGLLLKPVGLLGGFMEGWKQKGKLFDDYDLFKKAPDASIAAELEDRRNNRDPDEPITVPKGRLAETASMLGGTPGKALAAGFIGSAAGPEAGAAAGALVGGRESAKLEYAGTLQQVYNELRNQGVEPVEAVQKAKEQANNAAEIGFITGGAMGLIGGKIGSAPLGSFSNAFKTSIFNTLKQSGYELGKAGLEGLAAGGIGAAGQMYKNKLAKAAGINREIDDNVAEQLEGGLLTTVALAAAIKAGRGITKPNYQNILHGLSKLPGEEIGNLLNEKVQNGEIIQKAADETAQRIEDYKALDQTIPPNVTDEARFQIQDKIKKRQDLEAKLETADKAFHPEIKEKIKGIDEDILSLSKETQKVEKPESGLPKDKEKEATEFAEELLHEGILPDTFEHSVKTDPIGFWKMVAQQAQNRDENWKPLETDQPEQATRDQFGDTVVDYAKELFPAPEIPESKISVIQPGEFKQHDIVTIKPQDHAGTIRSDHGQVPEGGQIAGTGENVSSENIQQPTGQEPVHAGTEQQTRANQENTDQSKKDVTADKLSFGDDVGIAHQYQELRSSEHGTLQPVRGEGVTVEEAIQHGRDLMAKGSDPDKAASDFHADKKISYDAISLVRAKYEQLAKATNQAEDQFGVSSKEAEAARNAESNWYKDNVKPMQTEWSKVGQAQQGQTDIDTGSFSGLRRAFREETGKEPSTQQAKEAKELSGKVASLSKEVETLKAKLTEVLDKGAAKKPKTVKEKADQLADLIRKGKTSRPDTFSAASPASLVWDSALEIMAKTIEAGGSVIQSIADGVEHIRQSEWYKGLSKEEQTDAENSFNDYFKTDDLFTKFAQKKNSKFSPDEASEIWNYAKEEYLNKGADFDTMISGVAKDLGLKPTQVRDALVTPKGAKAITDEMYKKQYYQRQAINRAKAWVKSANTPNLVKALKFIPHLFFRLKTFGHGTVGAITHAGMNIFRPSDWKSYWPNFAKQFKFAFGKTADYEKAMQDLQNDPQYIFWKRAGLAVDPSEKYDDYQTFDRLLGRLGAAGDRGFNALKVMRLEMAKAEFGKLSSVEKADPETIKEIAKIINHATGTSKIPVPEGIGTAFFAPRLEASRWSRLIMQPARAIKTLTKWSTASEADKAATKIVAKRSGEMIAMYVAALAANQGILSATGSNQKINFLHPGDPDWLKFKMGGRDVDLSGGMVSALGFMSKLLTIAGESEKDLKGKKRGEAFATALGGYARGKLSPFGSTVADVATHHDYGGNTLPGFSDKPTYKTAHQLTWKEYLLNQQTPIPVAEAIKDATEQMKERGMSEPQINTIMQAIFVGAMSGGTGVRITPDISKEKEAEVSTKKPKSPRTTKKTSR